MYFFYHGCCSHEFGHALAAKLWNTNEDIHITSIGGLARLDKMPEKPIEGY
jgi:hypothetical protein